MPHSPQVVGLTPGLRRDLSLWSSLVLPLSFLFSTIENMFAEPNFQLIDKDMDLTPGLFGVAAHCSLEENGPNAKNKCHCILQCMGDQCSTFFSFISLKKAI